MMPVSIGRRYFEQYDRRKITCHSLTIWYGNNKRKYVNMDLGLFTEILRHDEEWRWRNSLPLVIRGMDSVYGGFYGDKLSQDSPKEVWEALRKCGISQIIDLRYDYHSEHFKARCKAYGISYFSYPIHNDPETIANIVEKFYDFSDLLNEGHFYMHGCTNSEITLCFYWVFGCNCGLYPLELRKSITSHERCMKKALLILNGIVKYKAEHADTLLDGDSYLDSLNKLVRDFKDKPYPPKVWYSIFDFVRAYCNESVVYDISVNGLGVVGYLYPSNHVYEVWEYDITMWPPMSGKARGFADAQFDVVQYQCKAIPHYIKYPALSQSTKMALGILRISLGL